MVSFFEKLKKGMKTKIKEPSETISEEEFVFEDFAKEKTFSEDSLKPKIRSEQTKEKFNDNEPETETIKTASVRDFMAANIKEIEKKKKIKEKIEREEIEKKKKEIKKDKDKHFFVQDRIEASEKRDWFEPEGQLVVDVYETGGEIVIQSAIAGVNPEELDISIESDMVIIKGKREKTFEKEEINYFYQECHWGPFSREIILPVDVDAGKARATMKNGILTIRMPKIEKEMKKVAVKEVSE
jgi:HSP20 family protein